MISGAGRSDRSRPDRAARSIRRGGLYIHVPFCDSICSYCHFARTDRHDPALRRRVAEAIVREFEIRRDGCAALDGATAAATAYIGGGTPSTLEADLFAAMIDGTLGRLPHTDDIEITAEANPESFSGSVAAAWKAAGVNRISLGVQSLDETVLRTLGRRCDPATARRALRLATAEFGRVSADWILAPGCEAANLAAEFREARELGVGHISFYILELHSGTPLTARIAAGEVAAPVDADVERNYLAAVAALAELGYSQYEVSNFALPGQESRHNSAYWLRTPYLGLGPGAHGFWGRRRYSNHADPAVWCDLVESGRPPEETVEILDPSSRRLEEVILPLRTAGGVSLDILPDELDSEQGEREGLWQVRDRRLRLTPRGMLRLDDVEAWLAGRL